MLQWKKQWLQWICLCLIAAMLAGCSASSPSVEIYTSTGAEGDFKTFFTPNEFIGAEEAAEGILWSLETASEGYIGIQATRDKTIIVQVIKDEVKYNYHVAIDGSITYIPLSLGEGNYEIRIMENTVDSKYVEIASTRMQTTFTSEQSPFLHANMFVDYDENSACVKKAAELAAESGDELEFVCKVYAYIADVMSYDNELAATVSSGYVPYPDRTYESKKGICFDIASMAAAMMRSQGVPAKLITGYVGKEALYHAWNSYYVEEQGWISVEIRAEQSVWNRLDLTFVVTGADLDNDYVDRYVY